MQYQNKFNNNTQIIGIIGHPIKHSFSPLMHNISFDLMDLNYIFIPFDVPQANLKDALKGMVALGIRGMNVTLPHKEKILQHLKDVSEEANIIGAVNTVVNDEGTLRGYNTDVSGIVETLLPFKDEIAGQNVTVIGAGGSARSVIYSLIRYFKAGRINIVNRTEQTAESLKEYFKTKMIFNEIHAYELVPPDLVPLLRDSKLIINATSLGMTPEVDDSATNIPEAFCKEQIVFDLVYSPLQTKFLKLAASQGAITLNGLRMLVEQGSKSFELWTGEKMPIDQVHKALLSYLTE